MWKYKFLRQAGRLVGEEVAGARRERRRSGGRRRCDAGATAQPSSKRLLQWPKLTAKIDCLDTDAHVHARHMRPRGRALAWRWRGGCLLLDEGEHAADGLAMVCITASSCSLPKPNVWTGSRWSEMEAARGGAVRGRQGRSGARARGRGEELCVGGERLGRSSDAPPTMTPLLRRDRIMFIEAEYDDNSASTVDICRLTGNNDEHHAEAFKRLIPPHA
uniref:Uncharacterized protein n=1 Tax=Oryza nivara TaxID=4536 RepID=A0A0E0HIA7_ORYNI